jgi:hypothetical protein
MLYGMRLTIWLALLAVAASAQVNRLTSEAKADYRGVRDYWIRTAEKMQQESYVFRPVPEVRTFAQLVAHVADDQYNLCAPVKREKRQAAYAEIEQTLSKKADLVPALKQAFAYCDAAYEDVDALCRIPRVCRHEML